MICYLYRYILWREVDEKNFENLILGGGNSLKPSSSACFEQYSNVKFGARKGAFTLAEVLITLGIIGVVAALTLPSLIQKYQDQVLENQLKKMYSTISQGIQKAMADDGVSKFSDTELFQSCPYSEQNSDACAQIVKKYFNVVAVKTDRREYYDNVIQVKYMDGRNVYSRDKSKRRLYPAPFGGYGNSPIYVLADGSEFIFYSYWNYYSGDEVFFFIDTNGEKGPNVYGFDVFNMIIINANEPKLQGNDGGYFEAIQKNNWKFPW